MNDEFVKALASENIHLTDRQLQQLQQYCLFLQQYNEKVNLTAITSTEEIYTKHFLDCLLLAGHYDLKGSLIDVGSGAGFPGVVLKIYDPSLDVTLLEPVGKKAAFLRQLCMMLELDDVHVYSERAEEFVREHREQYDFVTARAVAAANILCELCLPLIKVGGHFLAMKGPKADIEFEEASNALWKLGGRITSVQNFELGEDMQRVIINVEKTHPTDARYPRNYAQIKKKPL